MRLPLKTRPGYAEQPIEPGARYSWAVGLRPAGEAMALDRASEATSLGGADHVDQGPGLEHLDSDCLADLVLGGL